MRIWNQFERLLVGAVDSAVEYHRRKAQNQRLREAVKKENAEIARGYLALGKHYYESLRGKAGDEAADRVCSKIDCSQERMRRARKRLVDLRSSSAVAIIGGVDGPTAVYLKEHSPLSVEPDSEWEPERTQGPQQKQGAVVPEAQAEKAQNREAADESEEWIPPLPDKVEE